ncbi:hypothetical protein HYE53_01115 [Aggregatibacter actinomycetemcomitans]|uniref:hypothetical protein n=1 Tax=Aggregatibacter actinomycetemcomitans TaxID=714 RepID=UPI00197BCCF6|nr:hypothetical protein [Aggregatibacter actinomycetemcomitans]MBN6069757.1 hypothetical protein [Aggregatibacter actinomycetemcomitans]
MNFKDKINNNPLIWAAGMAVTSAVLMFGFMQYINSSNNDTLQNQINHLSSIKEEKESIIREKESLIKDLNDNNKLLMDELDRNKIDLESVNKNYNSLKNDYEKLKSEKTKLLKNPPKTKNDSIQDRIQELKNQKKTCDTIWLYPSNAQEQEKVDSCTQYNLDIDKRIDDLYKLLI